ncbi:hypothetical protein [Pandoraea sp. ISTKB]|uniref:hypothetical protein n=1 Tax=Pandoraea sp. ISTKB TaxID=1586708 RepID=UPI0008464E12|nr:hypothetical protein [Pandoraea sp. ISTKB]ODP32483.1 hypothetical protein A9762_22870 [Pandoraea sp. ISTKB]
MRQIYTTGHNEIILAAWPQNIPEQIPIEAFFYPSANAKPGAEYIQQDYMATTGRLMPVLAVDLTSPPGSIFKYFPEDQTGAMSPGALLSVPGNGGPYPGW